MRDYKTIKTRPREVRGRVMHVAGKASSGAAYFSADRLRAIRREAQVRKQETKPEGDAVSNVEDQASQTVEKVPYAAYRLTRAQIQLIKRIVAKRREHALTMVEEPVQQGNLDETAVSSSEAVPSDTQPKREAQTDVPGTASPEAPADAQTDTSQSAQPMQETPATEKAQKKPSRRKRSPPKAEGKSPDVSVLQAEEGLQDQLNRPLSERELAKARDNNRKKVQAEIKASTPAEKKEVPAAESKAPVPVQPDTNPDAESNRSPFSPRVRTRATDIQHERPPAQLPRTREIVRQPVEDTTHVLQRQRPPIRTADNAARTAAHQSAAQAAQIKTRAADMAKQAAAKNAEKAARHMAELARRNARRMAESLKRASEAAIRAGIAAGRALMNLLLAGGWIVALVIIVLLMCVSILASPFGIFTHTDATEFPDSISLDKAITTINAEYAQEIERMGGSGAHVVIEGNLEGETEPANWVDVLAIFSVHLTMREDNAMDVVQLDKTRLQELREIFWAMNDLKKMSETDEEGHTTQYIVGSSRTYTEMYERYNFTEQQIQLCQELMSDDYYAFWSNFVSESLGYGPADWGGVSTVDPDYKPGMSGSVMKIPAIYQFDYKKVVCTIGGQGKSASTSGCGATSMCMVIHYLTGNTTPTPYTLFKWAYDNGHYNGNGLSHEAVSAIGRMGGVTGKWIGKNGSKIIEALKSGHPVIAHMGPGIFTKHGHYIVLKGVTDDGKILVNDPNSKSRTGKAYPLSTILSQSKTSSPFMICSPAN